MLVALQVLAILLVSCAMAMAHALELPGKMRLTRDEYFKVQAIYYPGFTIGGLCEPAAIVATLILLFLMPTTGTAFWLTFGTAVALLAMHAAYWVLTHPVNQFWVSGFQPGRTAAGFFGFDPLGRTASVENPDWTELRDRWEFSHVVRAILGAMSLVLLAAATAV